MGVSSRALEGAVTVSRGADESLTFHARARPVSLSHRRQARCPASWAPRAREGIRFACQSWSKCLLHGDIANFAGFTCAVWSGVGIGRGAARSGGCGLRCVGV